MELTLINYNSCCVIKPNQTKPKTYGKLNCLKCNCFYIKLIVNKILYLC